MENKIEIYRTESETEINVTLENDTIWLSQMQMAELFNKDVRTINEHVQNIYKTAELPEDSTIRKFRIVRQEGTRNVRRNIDHYNLDMIISVGYRVNSKRGTQFRQWATQRLKDFLVQGYAINEKRLVQKQQEVATLKTGIRILNRAIGQQATEEESQMLQIFAKGLALLDAYDHEELDFKGTSLRATYLPSIEEYMQVIHTMYSEFESGVFAKPKDASFNSSINQIGQSFDGAELYPSIEGKAANLLYFITKNHSFVDGNKRIAAACFIYFLQKNKALYNDSGNTIISNEALASLTLFIATSRTEEAEVVKRLVISILNQNKQ
jgi:prophage maintenance system killer protein